MLWVDCENYLGPDRRRARTLRIIERRRANLAQNPPALSSALRRLRQRVIDATGEGAKVFAERVQGVAQLAEFDCEQNASVMLTRLADYVAERGIESDVREGISFRLDRIRQTVRAA
jgi:hypothetical protein